MLPVNVLHRGRASAHQPSEIVRAGPVSARFDPDGVFLRHIRVGDREILRGIYVAVRDHNWNTITPVVTNLDMSTTEHSFAIEIDVECRERDVDFAWHGTITGDSDGTIRYRMDGTARSEFRRNRIGILVLHPPTECAGKSCTVETTDGTRTSGTFPDSISPHQPFFDIQAISHEVVPGLEAEVRFTGDVFEMEDQRNWTDASYKTYSTPLSLPFPVLVEEGATVSQSVEIRLTGTIPEPLKDDRADRVTLAPTDDRPVSLPSIGLGISPSVSTLNDRQIARLRALNLGHPSLELQLSDPEHPAFLRRALDQAEAIGTALQISLFLTEQHEHELRRVVDTVQERGVQVIAWLVLSETDKVARRNLVEIARPIIRERFPNAAIGSGTNAYFTELNRERPDTELLDLICYSINPQVHAFDDLSLVETLEAQSWTVESARTFSEGRNIVVSPITLRPRFNPNATGAEPEPAPGELPSSVDPRQMSLLGAAWTLGSLKYISESGVESGTWFETVGWRGVMETDEGSPLPDQFPSLPGAVFPLYHALADFGEFRTGEIVPLRSTDPLRIDGCLLRQDDRSALLVANLSDSHQHVRVTWPDAPEHLSIRLLDETTAERAMTDPESYRAEPGQPLAPEHGHIDLTLRPFAIARIDSR